MMDSFRKQIWAQLGIAVISIGALLAANQFMFLELQKTAGKIRDQKSELIFRSKASEFLPKLKEDSEKARSLSATLNKILPGKEGLVNFGNRLIELAKSQKINATFNVKGDVPTTETGLGAIRFFITSDATYANFTRFLKAVEKEPVSVKFNSLDVNRKPDGDAFTVVANGEVFYQ